LEKKGLRILLVLLVLLLLGVVVVVAVWKEREVPLQYVRAGLDSCAVVVPASCADDNVVVCGCDGER